ncbi:unnamed protein product, partial [Ixodes pacificus]
SNFLTLLSSSDFSRSVVATFSFSAGMSARMSRRSASIFFFSNTSWEALREVRHTCLRRCSVLSRSCFFSARAASSSSSLSFCSSSWSVRTLT